MDSNNPTEVKILEIRRNGKIRLAYLTLFILLFSLIPFLGFIAKSTTGIIINSITSVAAIFFMAIVLRKEVKNTFTFAILWLLFFYGFPFAY